MIIDPRRKLRTARWTLTAALAGGSLFGACEVRLKDAFVGGSKDYVSSLLSNEDVLSAFFPFLFTDAADGTDTANNR